MPRNNFCPFLSTKQEYCAKHFPFFFYIKLIPLQVCSKETIKTLKVIPQTSCEQKEHKIKTTPSCPLVIENKVCQDVQKTFIMNIPKEQCELHPREVCHEIVKQYPSLQMVTKCKHLPRETCSPERVQPKEVTKPIIKKVN